MESRIKLKEVHGIAPVERNRNGYASRSLPPIDYFKTTSCARCTGLLVSEWCYDLENVGKHNAEVLRCVQCGYRVDPTILHHRIHRSVVDDLEERIWFQHSVDREPLEEAVSY
jgi:hypothetical protein